MFKIIIVIRFWTCLDIWAETWYWSIVCGKSVLFLIEVEYLARYLGRLIQENNPSEERPQAATPCLCLLASSGAFYVVVIRPVQCRLFPQPVLEDGTSRLEVFSSIWVGCNMKHVHTFACPVFVLQNALASGELLPVSTHQIRPQPWTQSYPCKECLPGTQFDDWVHISTVPLSIWWLLWDNTSWRTWCFWQHLLAATSKTFSRYST